MYRIIKNHPFNNGNKRTAIFSVFFHMMVSIVIDVEKEVREEINKSNILFIKNEGKHIWKKYFKKKKINEHLFNKEIKRFLKYNEKKYKSKIKSKWN